MHVGSKFALVWQIPFPSYFPPLQSCPPETSYGVWESIVSSPNGVCGRFLAIFSYVNACNTIISIITVYEKRIKLY